ncbi:MAG: sodium/glutamate symporter [Acidobacteria bacterium RIFCSPLOWO2_02_FULL_67_36]|nr:MAG: sodium/glutamate symporter [Acidobacteria bacterium RIFCSPLOWO2_02_FULL_67_36]OFW21345.1 MAG: sodium/glutamate symporter [Acidobacteria bacterium RIFCSPLOWO2_12_FULL_66_21]
MPSLVIHLDMIQTLALAAVVLFLGYGIRRRVAVLDRYNIPAPVVGGFLFAAVGLALRLTGVLGFEFDTTLQAPLMIAFFTTIGLGASLALLRVGGPQVLLFFLLASTLAVLQDGVGVALAKLLGVHPFLGLIAGSITMTGGHGTGAAFGKLMEDQYGFPAGVTLAMAAATFGLVSGGLIGGPIATALIRRHHPKHTPGTVTREAAAVAAELDSLDEEIDVEPAGNPATAYTLLKIITIILVAMWGGSLLSAWLHAYATLPAYIGAMIVAAVFRNTMDLTRIVRIEQRTVDDIGTIALSLFLAMALMSLKLWELLDLAVPMLIILMVQVAMMGAYAYFVTYRVMGRDYDAAVMAGGHCGFGLGATPNAVANMEAIVERFGSAPRAFLVVPMVGAFFIDFTNALIITTFINWVH